MSARVLVVAVASRLPAWAEAACTEYLKRMPRGFDTRRLALKPEPRTGGKAVQTLRENEAKRILAAVPRGSRLVALDERGTDLTTAEFAARLRIWLDEGGPVALIVGGPDGLDPGLRKACSVAIRLSSMTLPHALAQVLVCEQLYRAASLLTGHPYHRH